MTDSLHERIVDMIPSGDLRAAIRDTGCRLSDISLLATVFRHAPDFGARLEYLRKLEAVFTGELKAYAARLIETQQQMLEAFLAQTQGAVFELHIKDTPDACDEKYLCGSFEAVKKMIPLFYQEYDCQENPDSQYRIVKRRVFQGNEAEAFSEDYLGEAELLPGGVLGRVDMLGFAAEDCEDLCIDCERHCIHSLDVPYPRFTAHGDLVRYREHDGSRAFGVNLQWDDAPTCECYIIPLKDEHIRYRDFPNAHYGHAHISAALVEKADPDSLPEDMRENYLAYAAYLKDESAWG